MIIFTIEHLNERAADRRPGYLEAMLRRVTFLADGRMQISEPSAHEIAAQFAVTRVIPVPTPAQVAATLRKRNPEALAAWHEAGHPMRPEAEHDALKAICDACPDTFCRSSCNATAALRWLATAGRVGPHCKWPALPAQTDSATFPLVE